MSQNKSLHSSNKLMSAGLKAITSTVVTSMVIMAGAHAAGFGKLTILSSLGQPLRAEIELVSVAKDEESQLIAKLASVDAYKQANLEFNPALLSLQFSIDQSGARKFVRVTSTQPINEPFVAMLMELGGTKTRVLREYNVLLDPATSLVPQSPQVTAPVRKTPSAVASKAPVPNDNTTAFLPGARNDRSFPRYSESKASKPQRAERGATQSADAMAGNDKTQGADYRVKKGDTLYQIAGSNLAEGISIDQMLVALYRDNQNAFIKKNINRLRSGQILSIPDVDKARAVTRAEAKTVILAMSKDFNAYRNTLAGQLATATTRDGAKANQSGGGKVTAKVEEAANPANDAKDKLKLSRAGGASKTDAKSVAATEEQVARERASVEADERVKLLEKNINDLQKVLDQKSKNLDALQKQADNTGKSAVIAPVAPTAPAVVGERPTASNVTSTPTTLAGPAITAGVPLAGVALNTAPVASVPTSPAPKGGDSLPPAPPASGKATELTGQAPAAEAKPPETSVFSSLTDNPLLLPGAGLLALLLAAFGINKLRRNKQNGDRKENLLEGSTGISGGQNAEKNSVFNTNFEPSVSSLNTNVDPLAEADVYIAYGRDAQAEEILKEALLSQPSRNAIRVKLLEIYATRKDGRAFEVMARELYSLTAGAGDDWQQAAALGLMIEPSNQLYARGHLPERDVAKAASPFTPIPIREIEAQVPPVAVKSLHASSRALQVAEVALPLATPEKAVSPPLKAEPPPNVRPDLDFDFDFALKHSPVAQPGSAATQTAESAKSLMDSLNFDLDHSSPAAANSSAADYPARTETRNKNTSAKSSDEDFEDIPTLLVPIIPPSMAAPTAAAAPMEFAFAGMNLDLGHSEGKSGSTETTHQQVDGADPEMATKLDLALAYQEIGDDEGARELLEEVLKGGDVAQVTAAKRILGKLG